MDPYDGVSGFLPGRASLMLDVVVVAMFFVLLALGFSLYSVKCRRKYARHKAIQVILASTLLIVQGFARPQFKIEIEAVAARES